MHINCKKENLSQEETQLLQGDFRPDMHDDFRVVGKSLSVRNNIYLQSSAMMAFAKMSNAAKRDGIELYILSGTRVFADQKRIWESKFSGKRKVENQDLSQSISDYKERAKKILEYSSMPGTSRHHWGTDLDIAFSREKEGMMLLNKSFETGQGLKTYEWLLLNASKYGFCQPYKENPIQRSNGKYQNGYLEEKWHWSYKPLATSYLQKYQKHIQKFKPAGFLGAQEASKLYTDYVLNIHQDCN